MIFSRPGGARDPGCGRAAAGYTLLEAVVSLVIISIIMGATVSTIVLASRAVGDSSSGGIAKTSESNEIVEQITAELSLALDFSDRGDKAVAFTVPDRNGDGQAETIRYAWSGVAGAPLTRRYNSGPEVAVAENVHHFDLTYLLRTVSPDTLEPPQESDEVVLIYHDDASGGSMWDRTVEQSKWCGQYLQPDLPTNTTSWKITRIKLRARRSGGSGGQMAVQIRAADADGKPSGGALAEQALLESALSEDYEWVELDLGSVAGPAPGQGVCIVVKYTSGSSGVGEVEYEKNNNPMTLNTHWLTTNNSGASWSSFANNRDMRFYVHGTYTTQGAPQWP